MRVDGVIKLVKNPTIKIYEKEGKTASFMQVEGVFKTKDSVQLVQLAVWDTKKIKLLSSHVRTGDFIHFSGGMINKIKTFTNKKGENTSVLEMNIEETTMLTYTSKKIVYKDEIQTVKLNNEYNELKKQVAKEEKKTFEDYTFE